MRSQILILWLFLGSTLLAEPKSTQFAEIRFFDADTRRGIPLVEITSVNQLRFVTDNLGRIAFLEPGLMDQELFFSVQAHGYEIPKDGFGIEGIRITPRLNAPSEIKLKRKNIAERIMRLTGEGKYRDSILLGHPLPVQSSKSSGKVAGQDSVQAAIYQNKIYWFWGDTLRMSYPLGIFRMAGATTPIPDPKQHTESQLSFDYFVDKSEFTRSMMPLPERPEGVIWIEPVFSLKDSDGKEHLLGTYSRRKGLADELEHGIARYNDDKNQFEVLKVLPLEEKWRFPVIGPVISFEDQGKRWLYFGSPSPSVRVPATLEAILDSRQYEAFTCRRNGSSSEIELDSEQKPVWRWQKSLPPTDSEQEMKWIRNKKLNPENSRFSPVNANDASESIQLHRGSIRWNAYRKCWVMIANQINGKASMLGEVWYAESASPTGPFSKAVKVLTHDRKSFYNPCQHPFLDQEDGKVIHFEGTYTADFSGNLQKTSRYEYNQMLYRLDLSDQKVAPARINPGK
jgi:hypothetical protein